MGVNILDVAGIEPCVGNGHTHRRDPTVAIRRNVCDSIRISGRSVASDFAVDFEVFSGLADVSAALQQNCDPDLYGGTNRLKTVHY